MKTLAIVLGLTLASLAIIVRAEAGAFSQKEATMTARGTFEVKITPQPADGRAGGGFDRLFIEKQFHGELEAVSLGQMLAARTAVEGSSGGVALELVTGKLNGKRGSFILQHKSTMRQGVYDMNVTVVPDSGTDELAGIAGTMTIIIEGGKHSYNFEYTLGGK
ncbi:MAG TPA: DUF3224 domain-containing protein [Pyrinomonadaceae bacterium]